MVDIPITLRLALEKPGNNVACHGDGPTLDDPLPAVVEVSTGGYALARASKLTEVSRETTDDI